MDPGQKVPGKLSVLIILQLLFNQIVLLNKKWKKKTTLLTVILFLN